MIKPTPDHEFYLNGKWVEAKDLKVSDELLDLNLNKVQVLSINELTGGKVYNFTVEDNHNYFAENILVVGLVELDLMDTMEMQNRDIIGLLKIKVKIMYTKIKIILSILSIFQIPSLLICSNDINFKKSEYELIKHILLKDDLRRGSHPTKIFQPYISSNYALVTILHGEMTELKPKTKINTKIFNCLK